MHAAAAALAEYNVAFKKSKVTVADVYIKNLAAKPCNTAHFKG